MSETTVSIVLPCLNEAGVVGSVVREACGALRDAGVSGEVLVVDNGSTDGSGSIASDAGARVIVEPRRGYGAAYLAGFRAARGDVIIMADADGSYELAALPDFLRQIEAGSDLVMGSRFRGSIAPGAMPWTHRYIGSPVLSGLLNALYRTGVSDAHCGIRAFRRVALARMRLRMPGMEFASEMIVNAARAGLVISEVPVNYRVRTGASKLRSLQDGWRHLRFLLLYSPTHLFLVPGLVMLLVGLVLVTALLPGPITAGPFYLDIHFMVLGSLLSLVGIQVAATGLFAKTLAVALGLQPIDRTLRALGRISTFELGLTVGGVLFAFGFIVDASIAIRWLEAGGPLNEVRPALFALTVMLIGAQLAFAGFFLSAIDLQVRDPEPRETVESQSGSATPPSELTRR